LLHAAKKQVRPVGKLGEGNPALIFLAIDEQDMTISAATLLEHFGKRVVEFHSGLIGDIGGEGGMPLFVEAQYYIDRRQTDTANWARRDRSARTNY
jgi:hypothetical protein